MKRHRPTNRYGLKQAECIILFKHARHILAYYVSPAAKMAAPRLNKLNDATGSRVIGSWDNETKWC